MRVRGLTVYRRDPGPGKRWRHYHGYGPRLYGSFWCRIVGHSWKHWESGPIIDNGEGPLRFSPSFFTCDREGCDAQK